MTTYDPNAEVERLRNALRDAIEEMEDMVPYIPMRLRDKWGYDASITRAREALAQ